MKSCRKRFNSSQKLQDGGSCLSLVLPIISRTISSVWPHDHVPGNFCVSRTMRHAVKAGREAENMVVPFRVTALFFSKVLKWQKAANSSDTCSANKRKFHLDGKG